MRTAECGCWALLLACGCRNQGSAPKSADGPSPYAGIEVRVVVPAGLDLASSWAPGFEDWAAGSSASFSISEWDASGAGPPRDEWLSDLTAGSPTLVIVPTTALPRLLAEGLLAPIPESVLAENALPWDSIPPPVRKALATQGDKPAVFPLTCPPLVVYCRTDLLEAAGKRAPETWEEYDELVTTVGRWAPGHIAIEPRSPETLATLFLARAASSAKLPTQYSFELDSSTGDPLIASEAFVRTLEQMSRLSPSLAPDSRTASFEDCRTACWCGRAAIGIMTLSTDSAVNCATPADDAPHGAGWPSVSVPLPGSRSVFDRESGQWKSLGSTGINRPAFCGFAGLSACTMANASEREQRAAWDLLGKLIGLQDQGIIPPLPGVPCRSSATAAAVADAAASTARAWQVSFDQGMIPENPQLIAELPYPGRERLHEALADALRSTLDDDVPADEALGQAAQIWSGLIDDVGRKPVLNSYRRRLGLSALP